MATPSSRPDNTLPIVIVVILGLVVLAPFLVAMVAMMGIFGFGGHMGFGRFDLDFGFFPLFGFGFMALYWLLSLALAVWAYRDAESRNMIGILWALVVFFFPLLGIIIYLVVRANPPAGLLKSQPVIDYPPPAPGTPSGSRFCSQCGSPTQDGARFCSRCGHRVA
ncbi:MAG TPA: zinc-ribbon domain-containing protein [Candidatus Thermoplasmatota archaeon]|nr:zinc-ribbon domain-containing protein [Candidatus Thermoplasmatota archaeon]